MTAEVVLPGLAASSAIALSHRELPAETEEARWVARARQGDPGAIDWLVERYRERLVRLAAHTLRRPDEAEDVAQEAFVRAFRSLQSYRGDARFTTWLYRIVVRLCLDRQRTARWTEVQMDPAVEPGQHATGPAEAAATRLLVEALMDRLDPAQRAALLLREVEGLSYEEIAEVVGSSVDQVRWRLQQARERFRKMWLQAAKEAEDV